MRRLWPYALAVIAILLIGGAIGVLYYAKTLSPRARNRVISALQQRFDADVDLKSVDVSMFPQPKVVGNELSIRHKGWTDPRPLIYIRRFSAETNFATLIDRTNTVDSVRLEGLEIRIPPRGRAILKQMTEANDTQVASAEAGNDATQFRFLIRTIVADGAVLQIEPKLEGKDPLRFEIQKLTLRSVGPEQPMAFKATLTNARPPGLIDSTGRFGPWQRDDPRATAVDGTYDFQNADLSVFKGISGILTSTGSYRGVLQHIEVDGTTNTPDFALKRGGEPVRLMTKFHSVVNGTDGDTILDPVDARFLRSEFLCRGGIVHLPGAPGKTVALDAVTNHGRMEDILRLITGKKPFLTGAVNFTSKITIPPGHEDVLNKLQLDGQFAIIAAQFTSPKVEQKLETLSDRARGITKKQEQDEPPQTVASNFRGRFKLANGAVSFSQLSFQVPGADVDLKGKYDLRSEAIDMGGTFRMQATLSQTQSGVKHWILKPFDRLFQKNGAGFSVPIKITGTRNHPALSLEIFHRQRTMQ